MILAEHGDIAEAEILFRQAMNIATDYEAKSLELRSATSLARLLRERRVNPRGITLDDMEHLRRHVDGIAAATAWKQIQAEIRHGDRVVEDPGTLAWPEISRTS